MPKMLKVTREQLLEFAKKLEGKDLKTLDEQRHFKLLNVEEDGIVYETHNGKPVRHSKQWLKEFCKEFSRSKSLKTTEYAKRAANISYTLAVLVKYLAEVVDGTD
jgi:hypothetical protein